MEEIANLSVSLQFFFYFYFYFFLNLELSSMSHMTFVQITELDFGVKLILCIHVHNRYSSRVFL